MKTLALLSITLALPIFAQNQVVTLKPGTPVVTAPDPQPSAKTLSPEDAGDLALATMKAQGARINWLEKLIAKQAGADDAMAADQSAQERDTLRQSLVKKYGSCDGGQWNFAAKQWVCPPK